MTQRNGQKSEHGNRLFETFSFVPAGIDRIEDIVAVLKRIPDFTVSHVVDNINVSLHKRGKAFDAFATDESLKDSYHVKYDRNIAEVIRQLLNARIGAFGDFSARQLRDMTLLTLLLEAQFVIVRDQHAPDKPFENESLAPLLGEDDVFHYVRIRTDSFGRSQLHVHRHASVHALAIISTSPTAVSRNQVSEEDLHTHGFSMVNHPTFFDQVETSDGAGQATIISGHCDHSVPISPEGTERSVLTLIASPRYEVAR